MTAGPPPSWKLPAGVNASLWEYAHAEWLAESEEGDFLDHPLCREDVRQVTQRFREPGSLIDLGSGVGRMSLHFARLGFRVTAVELSHAMLAKLGERASEEGLSIDRVEANLCRLSCFPDGGFDYALSMFSTLGMIRGRDARRRALAETARILKPGGRLALHAHNLWLNLWLPQGRPWLLEQAWKALLRRPDVGDRYMTYRGIPRMEVHLYRWAELRRELREAGFRIDEVLPIDMVSAQPISCPWMLPGLRAGGWLVFATALS
jgi:ubiquinone/menaquinone biosynthesis C-methylase UbiE